MVHEILISAFPQNSPNTFVFKKKTGSVSGKTALCQVFTSHVIKKLVGLQVSESGEAAGAPEGGAAGGVSFVCLNAPSHVIQFVLYNVNQHSKQK